MDKPLGIPMTALWIIKHSDGDYYECTDWLNDDDGIGLQVNEMTPSELLTAWIEKGCTFEYSKEN